MLKKKSSQKGSAKARMRAARLVGTQAVYQWLVTDRDATVIVADFMTSQLNQYIDGEELITADAEHFSQLVQGVEKTDEDLFSLLSAQRPEGAVTKLDVLLQAILLSGAYELLACPAIDSPIIINDYTEVTKAFYDQKEAGLVNALLDKVAGVVRN